MNLGLTDEQRLLRDSAERFVADTFTTARRRDAEDADDDAAALWPRYAGLGWLALPITERHGGLGGGARDIAILMEAFGRGLAPTAYLTTAVLGAALITQAGDDAQQAALLPRIAAGELRLAFAFAERGRRDELFAIDTVAAPDGDGWVLNGHKIAVLDAPAAQQIIVSARTAEDIGLFLVPAGSAGATLRAHRSVGGGHAADLTLAGVRLPKAARLGGGDARAAITASVDGALIALCAEAVGMIDHLLDATLAYTRMREQFGRPLSANQVVRHRLADMAVAREEARAVTLAATLKADAAAVERGRAASAAKAKVGACARYVAEQAVQLHGAMGVTDELDIGLYLRRVMAFEALFGGSDHHHRRRIVLAANADDAADAELPLSADDRAFQREVRDFIATHLTADLRRAQALTASVFSEPDVAGPWQRALHARGWVAPAWPAEHGGTGWSPLRRWIFETECARAGTPSLSPLGLRMVGPVIIRFGTDAQKAFYLPRMLAGDDYWCQGYSEPGSGSDLASLKTRAVRDGDHYVVNGTKIWTTHAHHANRMFALVRTADTPRKQDGISFLLIDMTLPGITIRPIRTIGGDHEVNQVFFDDVRVPVTDRIGEENLGWTYGKYLLEFERGGGAAAAHLRARLEEIVRQARAPHTGRAADDVDISRRITELEVDIDTLDMIELRIMSDLQVGQNPGAVSSLLKLRTSEIQQAVTRLGVDVIGYDALYWEPTRPLHALNEPAAIPEHELTIVPEYLNRRAYTIFGGTSEVQRDIIAKAMLGL